MQIGVGFFVYVRLLSPTALEKAHKSICSALPAYAQLSGCQQCLRAIGVTQKSAIAACFWLLAACKARKEA